MARYRKIDPRIWNDEKFRELSDAGKLMFFMLLTHPNMTALGAMRATLPGLAAEVGWSPEAFRQAFEEASRKGMAEHDERACLVALPRFLKYNPPESPNVIKAWGAAVDLLPECRLKTLVLQRAQAFAQGMTEAFAKAFREAFPKGMPNQEQEQEQEQEEKQKQETSSPSSPAAPVTASTVQFQLDGDAPPARKPADLGATRAQRLAQVTKEAIEAFNASKLVKPNGGRMPTVRLSVGKDVRQKEVERCLSVAREICLEDNGNPTVTPEFWEQYFLAVHEDDFYSGRQGGGKGHENWTPDFELLTRRKTMLKIYDRAADEEAA